MLMRAAALPSFWYMIRKNAAALVITAGNVLELAEQSSMKRLLLLW